MASASATAWKVIVPALVVIVGVWLTGTDPRSMSDFIARLIPSKPSGPTTYVLSNDPVVVYIQDFITPEEAAHLVSLAYVVIFFLPPFLRTTGH